MFTLHRLHSILTYFCQIQVFDKAINRLELKITCANSTQAITKSLGKRIKCGAFN